MAPLLRFPYYPLGVVAIQQVSIRSSVQDAVYDNADNTAAQYVQ